MLRETTMEEISDGKVYGINDMVKADTGGCDGCNKCCTGMGSSIVLDPFDIWRLKVGLSVSFQQLLDEGKVELNMVDGLILPNIRMGEQDRCSFLDEDGRCSIHAYRASICRLFPLGRVYREDGFDYFLQKGECTKDNRAKIKVKKWIDTVCLAEHQQFICAWHDFIRKIGNELLALHESGRGEKVREITMYILHEFYVSDIDTENICGDEKELTEEWQKNIYQILIDKIKSAKAKLGIQK